MSNIDNAQELRCADCGNLQRKGAYYAYLKTMNTVSFAREGCLKCGSKRLSPKDTPLPEPSAEDQRMINALVSLCNAYAESNRGEISTLEAKATGIGEELNERGGIAEMRRIFEFIPPMPGKRTLEMHWSGIGDWR